MSAVVLVGTGHRPDKLGGYGNVEAAKRLVDLAIEELEEIKPAWVLSGMAQGWDTTLAWAAWALKIPFAAIIPCANQESRWPREAQERYRELRSYASWEIILAPVYSSSCMEARNRWMVDHATHVLALWNGTAGGTANCVRYAQQVGRPRRNCWERWERMRPRSRYAEAIEGIDYTDTDIPY